MDYESPLKKSLHKNKAEVEKAEKFVADLNNVADLLVLLAGKQRWTNWVQSISAFLVLTCTALIVWAGFEIHYLQQGQARLQEELREASWQLARAEGKIDEAKDEVKRTGEKVDEVAEATPKVEVDEETGKATVMLPVKSKKEPKSGPQDAGVAKDASIPKPPPPPPPPKSGFPLDPELGYKKRH